MSKPLIMAIVLSAVPAGAQSVLDLTFGDGDSAGHFERVGKGVGLAVSPDGKPCVGIDGAVKSLALKPVTVKPLVKYKLTIRAAIDGKDTVESNDRIPELVTQTAGRGFAGYGLTFLDTEGQETGFILRKSSFVVNAGAIISGRVNNIVHVFYSPPKADKIRLTLRTGKNKVLIERIQLELENEEGTVNCDPDFRYGELCPSGWTWDSEGRLYRRPDGKTVLKSGTSAASPLFIVNDQSRYSFYCKGTAYDAKPESGKATVSFYDENGVNLGTTHLFWAEAMKNGATKKGLKPPPGATQAKAGVERAIFEELRVTNDK